MKNSSRHVVIETILDAMLDDQALAAVPARLAEMVDGCSSMFHRRMGDGSHQMYSFNCFGPDVMSDYVENFAKDDAWSNVVVTLSHNRASSLDRYLPASEFKRTRTYNEFVRAQRLDALHCLGLAMPIDGGQVSLLGVHRGHRQKAFDVEEEQRLQLVVPYLRRLVQVRNRLEVANRHAKATYALLDQLPIGVLQVDAHGRVLYANASAETLLRTGDGLIYTTQQYIGAESRSDLWRLRTTVACAATASGSGAMLVKRSSGADPLQVIIAPFRPPEMTAAASAMLLVQIPGQSDAALLEMAMQMFGLSRAEAAASIALLGGQTAEDIADQNGVKVSTVQTQIKRAMEKTGTRKQSALAALLARLPVLRKNR
jgi:DNA-binding CsgD family transcriptional regulator/PAS domain-containing protein